MLVDIRKTGRLSNGAVWTWRFGDAVRIMDTAGRLLRKISISDFDKYSVEDMGNTDSLLPVQGEIDNISLECAGAQDEALLAFRFHGLLSGKSEIRKALRKLKVASIKAFREGTASKRDAVMAILVDQFAKRIAEHARGYLSECTEEDFNAYRDSALIRNKAESMVLELTA